MSAPTPSASALSLSRAGASAAYSPALGRVVLCGGQDGDGRVRQECAQYDPEEDEWAEHSSTIVWVEK